MNIKAWIEAMRLRTLPVSVAGVITAIGYSIFYGCFMWMPSVICLAFAVLAQITSNFANEYYDYKDGMDKPGRVGPRRGVTEGDITPSAMKRAVYLTLVITCLLGLSLVYWGGWWLIIVGLLIAAGIVAYSTGPYPLSRHCLGELAVMLFFGIIPVNFTFYIQSGFFSIPVLMGSISIGLMGANVLLVNNYRDADEDAEVNKITIAVKFGRKFAASAYLINGFWAVAIMSRIWISFSLWWLTVPVLYLCAHTLAWVRMEKTYGAALNPLLGITSMLMLFYSIGFIIMAFTTEYQVLFIPHDYAIK